MQCPNCGQANRTGAKFCDECGIPLPVRPVGETAALSSAQSTPEPPQQNRPPAPDPHAGRRQLTVMFCDIVGSMALAGQLDPEEWRDIVQTYQYTCAGVIQRFDGYIAQYLGDGLLVYFGYPIAHEDAAVRAVKAGLGILAQLNRMNSQIRQTGRLPSLRKNGKGAPRIRLRIGIHTGQVVVSDVGAGERHEQLALGETPNIAARLQSIAKANTAVMSAATYRLVEGFFECHTLGPHALRGKATPISVYQVIAEEGAQSRFEVALAAGLTPLVGRAEELEFLQQRWEQAKVREGQVVLLSGEPGIGKSRLVQELKEQVAKAGEARREFRCSSYARNTAFYSVIDHLQRWLQFQGDEPEEEKFRRLETALEGYRRLPQESVALFASLLALALPERYAPLKPSPEQQRQKTQEALVTWLAEESEERPLLIVWEDLHWVDPSTLDLVQMLIERAATLHLFVLLVFRSSEFISPWPPRPSLYFLTLNRLERRPVEDLIAYVAHDQRLPQPMVEHIAAQTDGVPLFVEELTKTIIEAGLSENGGRGAPSPTGAIPSTLQDSLMARLDQLSNTDRDVAQVGAVLGRAFSYALIRAVWPSDEQRLARGLAQLVEAELIFQKGVLPHAREHLQKAVALHNPEHHKALAFQYGTDPRTICLLYETLALWVLGYPEQALQKSQEALARAEEEAHQQSLSLAVALNWTGFLHQLRREAELTSERAAAGIALAQQCGFPDWEMIGTIFRDWATAAQSHDEAPVEQLQKVIAAWCATGAELLRPHFLGLLAEQYGKLGRTEKGLALLDEALAVVNTSAERFSEAELYRLRGELLLVRDANRLSAQTSTSRSNSEAESCSQKALFVARQQGAKSWELRAATSLAQQWSKQGKRESARRVLTETADWFTEGRTMRDFQAAQALLAELV